VVDMSEMAEMLKGLPGAKDSKEDGTGNMDMGGKLAELKALPGIKKVKLKKEKDGFIQRMSFRFADVVALNRALNVLMPDSSRGPNDFFRWEGSTLVRTTNNRMKGITGGMGGGTDDTTDVSGILRMMHYKFDMRFAEDLGEVQVAEGVIKESEGAKRIKLSTDWSVIDNDSTALDLRITLKR